MLVRDLLPLQAKLSYLIRWDGLPLILYQNDISTRPTRSVGIGLPRFYHQALSPRARISLIRIDADGYVVGTCRQIATIALPLSKASYVPAIDGHNHT